MAFVSRFATEAAGEVILMVISVLIHAVRQTGTLESVYLTRAKRMWIDCPYALVSLSQ